MKVKNLFNDFIERVLAEYSEYSDNPQGFKTLVDSESCGKYALIASALFICLSREQAGRVFKHFKI